MDIGTPERYLQASWDILEGTVETELAGRSAGRSSAHGADGRRRRHASPPRAVVAVRLRGRRRRRRSPSRVLLDGCRIGAGAEVRGVDPRAPGSRSASGATVRPRRVIGERRRGSRPGAAVGRRRPGRTRRVDRSGGDRVSDSGRDPRGRLERSARRRPGAARPPARRALALRVGRARAPSSSSGLIVCGMGGSAIGGVLARAAIGDVLNRPMLIFRDYELPVWTEPERAVLCSSYSGNTEETLACFEAAEAVGADRFVATTGGAPRRGRARGRRAGDRPARRAAAAPRGRLRLHRRLRDGGADRRRTRRCGPRSTPPPPTSTTRATASSPAPPRSPSRSPARCR